jgi:hypothetical protein
LPKNEKNKTDGKIYIRLDLEGADAQRFNELKKKLGLRSNTELIRLILTREFERTLISKV